MKQLKKNILQAITQEPSLVGEPGFESSREYVMGELTKLGLNPEIRVTFSGHAI